MTKQEQVKEILEVIKHCGDYTGRDCAECDYRLYGQCHNQKQCEAEALYNAGYKQIPDSLQLTSDYHRYKRDSRRLANCYLDTWILRFRKYKKNCCLWWRKNYDCICEQYPDTIHQ